MNKPISDENEKEKLKRTEKIKKFKLFMNKNNGKQN
jgi:hypothetical protein